jgi:hypothetical protein
MILVFKKSVDISFFETLIISLADLNFYPKHLISKKSLSASRAIP